MAVLCQIADQYIYPAEYQNARQINQDKVKRLFHREQQIDSVRNQKKAGGKGENQGQYLPEASGEIQRIIETAPAEKRGPIRLDSGPQLDLQLAVVLMELLCLLTDAFLYALAFGLFPADSGLFQPLLKLAYLRVIAAAYLIAPFPDCGIDRILRRLFLSLKGPLKALLLLFKLYTLFCQIRKLQNRFLSVL